MAADLPDGSDLQSKGKSVALPLPVEVTQVEELSVNEEILEVIDSLKKDVAAGRCVYVKEKMEENIKKLADITSQLCNLSVSRGNDAINGNGHINLLTKRKQDAICLLNNPGLINGETNSDNCGEVGGPSTAVLLGTSFGAKNSIHPIKLKKEQRIPPYTTFVFLDKNQRMTEDQSVLGRRRIYYDQNGGEALICSDSEEELMEDEEDKKEFLEAEDYILRLTIQKVGLSDDALNSLAKCFSRRPSEVKARYDILLKAEEEANCSKKGGDEVDRVIEGDKDLDAALDSFENLFCRRCLVFDCRLHGCSQDLVFPAEKQPPWNPSNEEKVPCSNDCYLLVQKSECIPIASSSKLDGSGGKQILSSSSDGVQLSHKKKVGRPSLKTRLKSNRNEAASSTAVDVSESSDSEIRLQQESISLEHSSSLPNAKPTAKCGDQKRNSKRAAECVFVCRRKKHKNTVASESNSVASGHLWPRDMKLRSNSRKDNEDVSSSSQKNLIPMGRKYATDELPVDISKLAIKDHDEEASEDMIRDPPVIGSDEKEEFVDENIYKHEDKISWKVIEKSLFAKGVEIFGRNSCLIARNMLTGMKTCAEIFRYMRFTENKPLCGAGDGPSSHGEGKSKGSEMRPRKGFFPKKGKVRRLKYTNTAYNSIRKRITEGKNLPCRQYNPCGCQSSCGKECPCLLNGTCCEKYCGCPKTCKNRFRGCHCAKSQCRSRQCPCFAANRECDPDVCRNCWISCGDGTFEGPSQRGDNYECRNMKLLLKQQQRVLLGRSDVSGWGAFLKNSVAKHEYLGEYTGEQISHREADKRGKIYDRENSSFLFNLNNQFVLDAYRKGDKLKFANHSPTPNCYAKVMMVAGDHRVGIFAKERINAGEELTYDYQYEPDRAPAWARKPEAPGARKEEPGPSHGRAKKLA